MNEFFLDRIGCAVGITLRDRNINTQKARGKQLRYDLGSVWGEYNSKECLEYGTRKLLPAQF